MTDTRQSQFSILFKDKWTLFNNCYKQEQTLVDDTKLLHKVVNEYDRVTMQNELNKIKEEKSLEAGVQGKICAP